MGRITFRVFYPVDENIPARVKTDIRPGCWAEVLEDFLRRQIGSGEDPDPLVERDEYNIAIQLDLDEDVFYHEHDCGNKGLRDGIMIDVLRRIKNGNGIKRIK